MTTNNNLEKLKYYENLYKKYKNKYIEKKTKIRGGFITLDVNKSYEDKLKTFKYNLIKIINDKQYLYFIEHCRKELEKSNLTEQEKNDLSKICSNIDKLNNLDDEKNEKNKKKIYEQFLKFIKDHNYINLEQFARIYVKEKQSQRYKELIKEFDRNNYYREGFVTYHKLKTLPENINLFKSNISNHYKLPQTLNDKIQNNIKEYFKDSKIINLLFN